MTFDFLTFRCFQILKNLNIKKQKGKGKNVKIGNLGGNKELRGRKKKIKGVYKLLTASLEAI